MLYFGRLYIELLQGTKYIWKYFVPIILGSKPPMSNVTLSLIHQCQTLEEMGWREGARQQRGASETEIVDKMSACAVVLHPIFIS